MGMDDGDDHDRDYESERGHHRVHDHANGRARRPDLRAMLDCGLGSRAGHVPCKILPPGRKRRNLLCKGNLPVRRRCLQHGGDGFPAPNRPDPQNPEPVRDICTSGNSSRSVRLLSR